MKTEKNILIAFLLNLFFSVFELAGGLFTGSTAILSDSVHDLGDALSIGLSWLLERKSKKRPDPAYTFGYARYSALGSVLTTGVLILGSVLVLGRSVLRLFRPVPIRYDGMIVMGVFGVLVNLAAALVTKEEGSLNQKAVNLHMLEDVLGWIVVLAGAVVMRFTHIALLDPLMSIGVSAFILVSALKNFRETGAVFLEKAPQDVASGSIRAQLSAIDGVKDVHHIHLWTLDGRSHYASLHAVISGDPGPIKAAIRRAMAGHGIGHVTIETENENEVCGERECPGSPADLTHTALHHHHPAPK